MNRPTFTLFAGANGAGKSTLTSGDSAVFKLFAFTPIFDPDAIAKTIQATATGVPVLEAGKAALNAVHGCLEKDESFAVETTFSGKNYLRLMLEARERGFAVVLITSALNL